MQQQRADCSNVAWLSVEIEQSDDDRTPLDQLGYIVDVEGDLDRHLFGISDGVPVRFYNTEQGTLLSTGWVEDAPDARTALDLRISITAVDLAGNMSVPSNQVRVQDNGGRCSTAASDRNPPLGVLAIAGLLLATRHRPGGTRPAPS